MALSLAELARFHAYDDWANGRLFDSVAGLSEEQFTRKLASSFPSLRETVAHILSAQWIWLRRFVGASPAERPAWLEGTRDELRGAMKVLQGERTAYFSRLRDEDLDKEISYRTLKGDPFRNRLVDLALHVVNHGTYHRGQATTLLRQLGAKPLGTDFVLFVRENG